MTHRFGQCYALLQRKFIRRQEISLYSTTNWMLLEFRDYIYRNILVTILILFFPQFRGGASGGRASQQVSVGAFLYAVIFIMEAFAHVFALGFVVVITYTVVRVYGGISII